MTKHWMYGLLLLSVIFRGGDEAGAQGTPATANEAPVRGSSSGQKGDAAACPLLEGIVPALFAVDAEAVTFRPSSFRRQDICRATWAPNDRADNRRKNEVRLTILGTVYDSPEAAVASLESTVRTGGTGSSGSGDWVDGVGDWAILNDTSVQVAAKARRFTVSVSTSDDAARNKERTLEVARELVDRM